MLESRKAYGSTRFNFIHNGVVLGKFVAVEDSVYENAYFIHSLGILGEQNWGKGYGTRMLKEFLSAYGDHDIYLDVLCENDRAISLYRKCGFEIFENRSYCYRMRRPAKAMVSL